MISIVVRFDFGTEDLKEMYKLMAKKLDETGLTWDALEWYECNEFGFSEEGDPDELEEVVSEELSNKHIAF